MLEPLLIVELAALGLGTGFLAGLLGIGGGMLMVPFVTLILSHRGVGADLAVKMAIATSMATIVFTSLSSVRAHHRRGAVRWDLVRNLAPGIVLGALGAGAGVFRVLSGRWLALLFAVFVAFSATQMLRSAKRPAPAQPRGLPTAAGQWGAGGLIGFVSGLVGAGGGFISVPIMTWWGVAMHQAVATSAALGFPIALANVLGYLWSGAGVPGRPAATVGYVFVPALAVIASASVLMAPVGVRVAHALPVATLKRVFAVLLYGLAVTMAYKAWHG
ncbi:sulfite exporter TauE/SafE family protein [Tepidimonas ignava]|uniref:sulfite exporter TauE/SafE family protein n=1 Tax=Tepidimonas ignava TaxID=114249 RepID=UPI002FD9CE20